MREGERKEGRKGGEGRGRSKGGRVESGSKGTGGVSERERDLE